MSDPTPTKAADLRMLLLGEPEARAALEPALAVASFEVTVHDLPEDRAAAVRLLDPDAAGAEPDLVATVLGVPPGREVEDLGDEAIDRFLEVCVQAPMRIAAAGMPQMTRRGSGSFVWIVLRDSNPNAPELLTRCAEEAALALSRGVALELEAPCASNCLLVAPTTGPVALAGALDWLGTSVADVSGRVIELSRDGAEEGASSNSTSTTTKGLHR